jgi:mono/diheme cytochrome c family protein
VPRKRRNPWTSTGEVLIWLLFAVLLFPAAFAGYAVGHYTSLGKPPATVTVNVGGTVSTPTTTSGGTTTSSGGSQVAAGKALFTGSSGCSTCHTFTPAGSSGTIGPNLDTAPTQDAKAAGMPLAAFIKQSIVDPQAYIAKGFTKPSVMPGNFGSLGTTKIDALVAFIVSGQSK